MRVTRRPLSFWIALLVVAAFGTWFALSGWQSVRIETSVLDLLPGTARAQAEQLAVQQFSDAAARELLLLVSVPETDAVREPAAAFVSRLRASPSFAAVEFEISTRVLDGLRNELGKRATLLSERHLEWLEQGEVSLLEQEALQSAYTPLGLARPFGLAEDPLGLAAEALAAPTANGAAQIEDDFLAVRRDGRAYALLRARLAGSPFALPLQQAAESALAEAQAMAQAVNAASQVIGSGVFFHAADGAKRARDEISRFGTIGVLAIVALLVVVFRSLRPLLSTLAILALATATAIAACQTVFGNVHLLTLTFGTSLIGVAVDYALHHFSHRLTQPPLPAQRLRAALLLGCGTTIAGYLALLIAPIAGLRQIALYSAVGLAVACAAVIWLLPPLDVPSRVRVPRWAQRLSAASLPARMRLGLLALLAILAVLGLARLEFVDDLRALQRLAPALAANDAQVRDTLQTGFETSFALVTGASAQTVLQREESLRQRLQTLESTGQLQGHLAVSQSLPSLARQAKNRALLERHVAGSAGALARVLRQLGFTPDVIAHRVADYQSALQRPFMPSDWLASPASAPMRSLWLQPSDHQFASVVLLRELADPAALRAAIAGLPGTALIDQVADINHVLRVYRETTLWVLIAVAVLVLLVLFARYRNADAVTTALPAIGGVCLTAALLGLAGEPLNLLSVLALLLVLGMGVDYAVFLREGQDAATILAVVLSSLTTLLSFGLLALSSVPFVRTIGLTVTLGIGCALSLSLLLRMRPST